MGGYYAPMRKERASIALTVKLDSDSEAEATYGSQQAYNTPTLAGTPLRDVVEGAVRRAELSGLYGQYDGELGRV